MLEGVSLDRGYLLDVDFKTQMGSDRDTVGGTPTARSPQIAVVLHSWNYAGHNLHKPNDFDQTILWAELYPQNSYVEVSTLSTYECKRI